MSGHVLSRKMIRSYHQSAMEKATLIMGDTRQCEYERRLVTSMCLTVDSLKIREIKKEIQSELNKIASKLSKENTNSVDQMNFQLVPLTENDL